MKKERFRLFLHLLSSVGRWRLLSGDQLAKDSSRQGPLPTHYFPSVQAGCPLGATHTQQRFV